MSNSDLDAQLTSARELSDAAVILNRHAEAARRDAIYAAIDSGVSQADVARRLGLTQARVSQILKARH